MTQLRRWLIWLSRIPNSQGFGIQSPTDFDFVRSVVNEHWPYYAYQELSGDDWLTTKLGHLYFRLANWRQPQAMLIDQYQRYWQAGCRKTAFKNQIEVVELARIEIEDQEQWSQLLAKSNQESVIIVEGIWRNPQQWASMISDEHVGTTFDLYYCGIVLFDTKRYKHHYKINF